MHNMNEILNTVINLLIGILFILFFSSCDLFRDSEKACDNLVMTDETGLEIGKKGDPSDQWTIKYLEQGSSFLQNVIINPVYPNPIKSEGYTNLTYIIPNNMRVKIEMVMPNGEIIPIIGEVRLEEGTHNVRIEFGSENGCVRFNYFFNGSSTPNAYGLLLVE